MKILIVDDSRAMQTIVRRGIEQLGYDDMHTRYADNGKQALDIVRKWEPDLILSDWHMPEMTGLELLHALNREMLSVKVGFVTTETSESRKIEALSAGAKFFVQKPFDYKTLHQAVMPILQGSEEGKQALEYDQLDETQDNHIVLPDIETLKNTLTHFSKPDLYVESAGHLQLQEYHMPCLLGLYQDPQSKKVRAVAVMDLNAACILGACITNMSGANVRDAIAKKVLHKAMIGNCKKLMQAFGTALYDQKTRVQLSLRSTNIMREKVDSITKLLNKPQEERIDAEVTVPGYGSGHLTIIAS
ncbi:MAG: response regulator [Pseudomonadota bacterium]